MSYCDCIDTHYNTSEVRLICADAIEGMRQLPDASIDCIVTSPPYYQMRNYGVVGQIGLEATVEEYVNKLVTVFREAKRILKSTGSLWLNLGDTFANTSCGGHGTTGGRDKSTLKSNLPPVGIMPVRKSYRAIPEKCLIGIPWRVALALIDDGWILRSDIIYHKKNCLPESVKDRVTRSHEYVFLFVKQKKYYYDSLAIAEPLSRPEEANRKTPGKFGGASKHSGYGTRLASGREYRGTKTGLRNRRSVWSMSTAGYSGAHFAVMPQALAEICILAGTSEYGCCPKCGAPWERLVEKERTFESGSGRSGDMPVGKHGVKCQGGGATLDVRRGPCVKNATIGWRPTCRCSLEETIPATVLDPFCGSGTTLLVARCLGRHSIGIDIKPEYIEMTKQRLSAKKEGLM